MEKEPLVSVIIPMYNRAGTIRRAIDSVLRQTYRNIELIVVDDASTDNSVQIVQEYAESRLRLITLPRNAGAARARNAGMKAAQGEYIAFQDSDDEWLPDKIRIQMEYMLREGFLVSFCPYLLVLDDATVRIWPAENVIRLIKERGAGAVLPNQNVIGTPTLVMHREVMDRIGYFDEDFSSIEDYDYAIRIAKEYAVGFWEEPLMKAYRQEVSLTTDQKTYRESAKKLIVKHSDYMDAEDRIRGTQLFHTMRYEEEFEPEYRGFREAYSKGDADRQRYFDEVLLKDLAKAYIRLKRVAAYQRAVRLRNLHTGQFAIYGTGNIGREIYDRLKQRRLLPRFFLVSSYGSSTERILDGIPVRELAEIADQGTEIIVAVSLEKQEAILRNLRQGGFENYFILDEPDELDKY